MTRARRVRFTALLFALVAIGGSLWQTGAAEMRSTARAVAQPATSEPVYPAGFDAAMLTRLVDKDLAEARAAVERLVDVRGRRTAANTLRPFDDAVNATQLAEGLSAIAADLHPDVAIRAEGLRARERISRFRAEFATDTRVAKAFAALDTTVLTPEERLMVGRIRRDYHRTGADGDEATRARLRVLFETHDRLTIEFLRNMASSVPAGSYRRGWPANGAVLDSLLHTREEIAHLAGSRDWASYQAEIQMARSVDAIRAFLDQIRSASEPARRRATARYLERARREDPSITRLRLSQVSPAGEMIRREQYAFNLREFRDYFPFERVKKGVLSIVAQFFDVELRRVDIPVWHPSVEAYEVKDHGRLIGRVYLDLHPRPEKIPNALGKTVRLRGGIKERQLPEAILVAALPGGEPGGPGLMGPVGIGTFFHEFGHVMNQLLSARPYVSTGGFPEEVDFWEVPSLMLQDFTEQPVVLRRLSGHVQTGAPIPDDLLKRMYDAYAFSRPMEVGQNAAMAAVSLEMHDRPSDKVDPDALARLAFLTDMDVDLDPEMHFPTSLEHFGTTEYSASMYTFLWAQVIVKDLWSAFDPANPLDPHTARRYVDAILRPGKSRPPAESVREFLGRPFNLASWRRWLEGDERR